MLVLFFCNICRNLCVVQLRLDVIFEWQTLMRVTDGAISTQLSLQYP